MHHVDNRICIMGMGYVGLTLATVMADRGFQVHGTEINDTTLSLIEQGKAHFFEVNLETTMRRVMKQKRLTFSKYIPKDEEYDVYIVTVGTPLDDAHEPRLDMVESVTREIANHMRDGALVILRSTLRLGTTRNIVRPILTATGKKYELAFCPERTVEGKALEELTCLPQIVGADTEEASLRVVNIFRRLTPTIVNVSSCETAELIKLLDNSFRDVTFAFGNEVALLCEKRGLSAREVIKAANFNYPRTHIAQPGFVGGPCLEKDPHILVHSLKDDNFVPEIIYHGRQTNEKLVEIVFDRVVNHFNGRKDLTISLLGMAFKGRPETSDLRGSVALHVLRMVRERLPQCRLLGQDYVAPDKDIEALGIEAVDDVAAFDKVDAVMVLNNHPKYNVLDFEERMKMMNRPGIVYDVWNVVSPNIIIPEGITYHVFGR
jgi:UDP-N-acetyl-D-mannosaminuronic acid dehydrogenase